MEPELVVHQLKAGRDFARGDDTATSMANFVYLIADKASGEALVVDPAWDVAGIDGYADQRELKIVGGLITHWHPDHVGGPLFGHTVEGLSSFLQRHPVPVYVGKGDVEFVKAVTGVPASELVGVDSHHVVKVGGLSVECLHTPGHTAGSQCFRCGNAVISGDTLFLQGCGRLDLPGSSVDEMWRTLTERLATLPADTIVYPGHNYDQKPSASLGEVRRTNPYLQVPNIEAWRRMMGRAG